jgi:polar amino acid transport system substrate-binding protein
MTTPKLNITKHYGNNMNFLNHSIKALLFLFIGACLTLSGCSNEPEADVIKFATSPDYFPFEYLEHEELKGFDIELARMISDELKKKAEFHNFQFSSIFPAISSGRVDAAISTISLTPERAERFDFSEPYYNESMAAVFFAEQPIKKAEDLAGKKVACQLGSSMEIWLKKHAPEAVIVAMDNNNQSIEALKAKHVDVALLDAVQGKVFTTESTALNYTIIGQSTDGYRILFLKGSPLVAPVNDAIMVLRNNGSLQKLVHKWIESDEWKS